MSLYCNLACSSSDKNNPALPPSADRDNDAHQVDISATAQSPEQSIQWIEAYSYTSIVGTPRLWIRISSADVLSWRRTGSGGGPEPFDAPYDEKDSKVVLGLFEQVSELFSEAVKRDPLERNDPERAGMTGGLETLSVLFQNEEKVLINLLEQQDGPLTDYAKNIFEKLKSALEDVEESAP